MRKIAAILALLTIINNLYAQIDKKSETPTHLPRFISVGVLNGAVLPTNTYITEEGGPRAFSAINLKYGTLSDGNSWEDIAYGMPYGGIGIYAAKLYNHTGKIGTPISLFVFQGGTFARISDKINFNYELNLGMSFGWVPYDPFDNPLNIAIGSTVNAHLGFDFYFKWYMSKRFDLNFGVNISHFSNGDSRLPNAGFNLAAPSFSLVYNFNRKKNFDPLRDNCPLPPVFRKRMDHDLSMIISSRQAQFDTLGTGMPSPYIDRKFKILGLGYAMLFANTYKYKWGPALDLVYDESSGAKAWRQLNPEDGKMYDRIKLGTTSSRFSLGLAIKGELSMPRYSLFANVGWNMIYGNKRDARLYQILGLKIYLKENFFGTFGIRASHFSSAQYLYWSLGYTIAGKQRQ